MPYYWSQIETLENLQYVAGLVDGFNQDRFLAALMGKRSVGKDKIVHMRNELVEITNQLTMTDLGNYNHINNPFSFVF